MLPILKATKSMSRCGTGRDLPCRERSPTGAAALLAALVVLSWTALPVKAAVELFQDTAAVTSVALEVVTPVDAVPWPQGACDDG